MTRLRPQSPFGKLRGRSDSPHAAHRLFDYLDGRLGDGTVFIDLDTIESGADFLATIEQALASCRLVLAIIGPRWLSASRPDGSRRLDHSDDYVRMEVATAFRRGVTVIPVLVDGAQMPAATDLPRPLRQLSRRNAFEVRLNSFRADCVALGDVVERAVSRPPLRTS